MAASNSRSLLIDNFLSRKPEQLSRSVIPEKVARHVQTRAKAAKVFVFDDAAALRFAKVIREIPELVAEHQQFARSPYESCWIEFPFQIFWEAITGRTADATADQTLAYFFDHGVAYVIAGGTSKDNPTGGSQIVPARYHMREAWPKSEQERFMLDMETNEIQVDAWLWGEAIFNVGKESRQILRENNRPEPLFSDLPRHLWPEVFLHSLAAGASGDLRNLSAILLLLNRPSLTRFVKDVPRGRGFISGKMRPFMAHTVVTIDLDPTPTIRHLGENDDKLTKRRHEVRGHYCNSHVLKTASARGCEHVFIPDVNARHPEDSWVCTVCEGKRWWRAEHARGDSGVGYVNKAYEVTG